MSVKSPYKKSVASRKQVLDAAIAALSAKGFANTSISDVAAAAGMSKGAVHYHFVSKDDLITCVLEHCCQMLSERVRAVWEASGAPADKVRRALREMWAARRDGGPELRVVADLMAQGVHDPKLRKPLGEMFQVSRAELVTAFVSSLESTGLRPKIPAHIIPRLVLATLDGLALHNFFDPPAAGEEEDILRALEVLAFSLFDI